MGNIKETMTKYRKHRLEKLSEKTDYNYVDLDASQEKQILNTILNMPTKRQNLLVFKNYYKHTFDEIEDILDIENPKGEYLHLIGILSESLNIENAMISENSMQKVCFRVADKINKEIMKDFKQFNSELKSENNDRKSYKFTSVWSRKVASVVLIVLISSALLVGANVYARGKIFKWIVDTFDKYASFNISEENTLSKNDVEIDITYIPDGFKFVDSILFDESDTYYYTNEKKILYIVFIYENYDTYLDTENVEQYEFEIDDGKVITWKKDMINYFVFSKDGIGCQIYGSIDKEDFIEIYNGISVILK